MNRLLPGKQMTMMAKKNWIILIGIMIYFSFISISMAETLLIRKKSGIVWEGHHYNLRLTGTPTDADSSLGNGIAYISPDTRGCVTAGNIKTIGGIKAYEVANGIGIAPRATVTGSYYLSDGTKEYINGTIGINGTTAVLSSEKGTRTIHENNGFSWCLNPAGNDINYYDNSRERDITIKGNWVMVSSKKEGKSGEYPIPAMYGGGATGKSANSLLYPSGNIARVNNTTCKINSGKDLEVDFGNIATPANNNSIIQLAQENINLIVECSNAPSGQYYYMEFNGEVREENASRLKVRSNTSKELPLFITINTACDVTGSIYFNGSQLLINYDAGASWQKPVELRARLCALPQEIPATSGYANLAISIVFR